MERALFRLRVTTALDCRQYALRLLENQDRGMQFLSEDLRAIIGQIRLVIAFRDEEQIRYPVFGSKTPLLEQVPRFLLKIFPIRLLLVLGQALKVVIAPELFSKV